MTGFVATPPPLVRVRVRARAAASVRIWRGIRTRWAVRAQVMGGEGGGESEGKNKEEETRYNHRFDPESETDAFGRDPKKETEFWMGAATDVLKSEEVQAAIAEHAEDGGDGLTEEQRAYMAFIEGLDAGKGDADAGSTDTGSAETGSADTGSTDTGSTDAGDTRV